MRLNLGCGMERVPGWVGVDKYGSPEVQCDLEVMPWPWPTSSVDEIRLHHVLEHLGAGKETFIAIVKEMYRVLKPSGRVRITVPHPRCDDFLNDPTHVRVVTPEVMSLFSKRLNREWAKNKESNTPLGLYHDVDFEIGDIEIGTDKGWTEKHPGASMETIVEHAKYFNNVIREITIHMQAVK